MGFLIYSQFLHAMKILPEPKSHPPAWIFLATPTYCTSYNIFCTNSEPMEFSGLSSENRPSVMFLSVAVERCRQGRCLQTVLHWAELSYFRPISVTEELVNLTLVPIREAVIDQTKCSCVIIRSEIVVYSVLPYHNCQFSFANFFGFFRNVTERNAFHFWIPKFQSNFLRHFFVICGMYESDCQSLNKAYGTDLLTFIMNDFVERPMF